MRKDSIFYIINEINEELSLSNNPRQICNLVLNVLTKVLNVDASWIRLEDAGSQAELLTVTRGLTGAQNQELQAPELRRVIDDRIGIGDLVIIPEISRDEALSSTTFVNSGFGCLVIVPLVTYQVRGVLGTMWRVTKGFDADFAFLLTVIGNLVCSTLERAALYERLVGRSEPEAETRYDIEEFEKLVALAERYSRATRLAIKEAVVRAKGSEGITPPSLAVFGEGVDLMLPEEGLGTGNGEEGRAAGSGPAAEVTPGGEDGVGAEPGLMSSPDSAVVTTPGVNDPLASHERRMKAFIKLHPGHLREGP
jgi:hypothetical protein